MNCLRKQVSKICFLFVSTWLHSWIFGGVRVSQLFNFLYWAFCFVCLIPNVTCVCGLSILDCPFGFL